MANISTTSSKFNLQEEKRDLPRALMGGTSKMREEGTEFLPQHPAESDAAYKVRLQGTTLYNGFADTVKKQAGKVFSKPIVIGEDVPPQIQDLLPNIDGQGRDLTAFALDTFKEAMIDGVSFILIDFPVVTAATEGEAPTMADQNSQGARPYTVLICADNLIDWDHANRGGKEYLTEIRIKEEFTEDDPANEWAELKVEQIRLLRPGAYELHRKEQSGPNAGKWILYDEGQTTLDYIPIVPVYVNRTGYYEGEPPLMPLAELNLEHWISSSEQRKALTFARFAMLVLTGVDPNSIVDVGPDKTLKLPAGATAGYAEPSGTGIEAGRLDLEAIEKRMQSAGMTINVQTKVAVTATSSAIDSKDANSALMAAATSLEDSLSQVLQVFADYLGLPDGGIVQVHKGFGEAQAAGTIDELLKLYMGDAITKPSLLSELKRRRYLDEDFDIDAEVENIGVIGETLGGNSPDNQTHDAQAVDDMAETKLMFDTIRIDSKANKEDIERMIKESFAAIPQPQAVEPQQMDMQSIVDAIAAIPAPVVNVAAPIINVPAPIVNFATQESAQMPPIIVNAGTSASKTINLVKNSDGSFTADVKET